jgi:tellurite resistance protein TerC
VPGFADGGEVSLTASPAAWVLFNAFILVMLALDLGVFHRKAHVIGLREAAIWTSVWVALALVFNLGIFFYAGTEIALEFLTGYVLEKSLSIDNIFVIVMIFGFFSVPARYQHRVLFWGVLGALVMRGVFIGLGTYILHHWHPVSYVFGGLLLITGIRMALRRDDVPDLHRNPVVRLARRLLPISRDYYGTRFFVRESGVLVATPLFLVLLMVELSDIVFATDSIPAVFAITDNPFIVYTSNVFAILGLRSMYFFLADVVRRFVYLKYGLSLVLAFIGAKMLIADFVTIPTIASLGVIACVLTLSIFASMRSQAALIPEVIDEHIA